jgi:hypothetical protein
VYNTRKRKRKMIGEGMLYYVGAFYYALKKENDVCKRSFF